MRKSTLLLIILATLASMTVARHLRHEHQQTILIEQRMKRDQRPYREINLDLVRRVFCAQPKSEDGGIGTAWMIGRDTFVTAAHLAEAGMQCIDVDSQAAMRVAYVDTKNDIAILKAPTNPQPEYIEYSCDGFENEGKYLATGWAGGEKFKQTYLRSSNEITALDSMIEGQPSGGLRYLSGTIYRGMSGGPVFDDHGVAVGINSATDSHGGGFSRDLRDTILCRG